MGKLKRMDQVQAILDTYSLTGSIKRTAKILGVSKNTVKSYLRRAKQDVKVEPTVLQHCKEKRYALLYGSPPDSSHRSVDFEARKSYWIKELPKTGVTRSLLWQEYKQVYPQGYSYSQFCELLKRELGRHDLTLSLDHKPGKIMQADFAGKKMFWTDRSTGEVHECEMFIAAFPFSHHGYAIAVPSQKTADFIYGLNEALRYFGKLPELILSDNLKSYVTKADRYEPKFNELCEQLGAYYGIGLKSTRVAKPKDKGSVENMVSQVYRSVYAPLRNETFHSIEELNVAIMIQLTQMNQRPFQKRQGCRQECFDQYEKPQMRDLPGEMFEIKKITKAKVQRNYHVFLGEDKNYYSLPYKYVGKNSLILYTRTQVEVYIDTQRVAVHKRIQANNSYRHQTDQAHMPSNHKEWLQAKGYKGEYFLNQASKIGPMTYWAISRVLQSQVHQAQSYNSCKGILRLSKTYSPQRMEAAATRCHAVSKVTYSMLKRILKSGLDKEEDHKDLFDIPRHGNIRGPQAYQ